MKTGVFLCTCGRSIDIDFKRLKKNIRSDVVLIDDLLCHEGGLARITDTFKRYELGQALIACTTGRQAFESLGFDLLFLNLREHCAWVHDRKEATEKAGIMIKTALHCPPPKRKISIDVGKNVLVMGDFRAGIKIAQYLSMHGNVHVLVDPDTSEIEPVPQEAFNKIKFHAGSLKDIEGRLGEFRVNIIENPIDIEKCISCGRCLDACPVSAISSYPVYAIGKKCDSCGKCIPVCPSRAIGFTGISKTMKAGQILVIGDFEREFGQAVSLKKKKGIYFTGKEETDDETIKLALPAAMEILSNMGKLEQDKLLTFSPEGCPAGKSGLTGCSLCEEICRHGAITRRGDRLVIDEISCRGCCACASVCPLSLPKLEDDIYSKMECLLKGSQLSRRILMFAGTESIPLLDAAGRGKKKYPVVLPLIVPCTEGISEAHILRAFDLGADGVILMGRSCNKEVPKLADLILKEFGLDGRIRVIESNDDEKGFIKAVTSFSELLTLGPLRKHEPAQINNTSKRQIMLELIAGFAAKTGTVPGMIIENTAHPFANLSIESKCTVCGACTAMCPAGALGRENGSIKFIYGYCIACGLCERACPETALKMHKVLDLAKLVDTSPSTLFESRMLECASCRKPYMTAAALDRITGSLIENVRDDIKPQEQVELIKGQVELLKYCNKCRPVKAIHRMELLT